MSVEFTELAAIMPAGDSVSGQLPQKMASSGGGKKDKQTEDGDFVALRDRRENKQEDTWDPLVDEEMGAGGAAPFPSVPVAMATETPRPMSARSTGAVSRVFEEAAQVNRDDFDKLLNQLHSLDARDPDTNQTILLHVLHIQRLDLAHVVLARADVNLLVQDCDVTVASLKGKKNVLHYVTEMKDVELAGEILNNIMDPSRKMALLTQETPVQIQGQRPRTLPCCHLAAFLGCKKLVDLYLSHGVDVNAINSKKDTALLWAARWNHLDIVQELLSRRADTNIENDKGSTALYWAVRYGHTDSVRLLISQGRADVSKTRKLGLVSPVVLASALGYLPIVKLLVEAGADPNTTIRGKETPLQHAAREGYADIVGYLLTQGARVDEKDDGGDTALLNAARYGHGKCLKLLLSRGANHRVKNHMGEDLMTLAVDSDNHQILKLVLHFTKIHGTTKGSRSPLLLAASAGHVDKVKTLLTLGLDPATTDEEGNTIMHHAAMENRHEVITQFHGKTRVDTQNTQGNTALHEACARGHVESITALISSKATASIRNNRGETALHVAAFCRTIQAETVRKLMDYVIKSHAWESLNIKDNEGNNALHVAAKVARPEVMWEFRHVPFKVKDADGNIALHEAVRPDEPDALSTMLDIYETMKRDADINEQNNKQQTVLHLAATEGFTDHVPRLVLLGADLSKKDEEGNTVFHTLTKLSAMFPHKAKMYLTVFQALLGQVSVWWCMRKQIHLPHGDREALEGITRQASMQLLANTFNNSDSNVIAMACRVGASDIVHLITSKPRVMCYHREHDVIYNVTNMTPLTNNSVTGCCGQSSVIHRPSYIEFLTSLEHPDVACKVLDVQPFREIEKAYGSVAAWTYAIVMILHIVYMSLLSYSGVELLKKKRNDPDNDDVDAATVILYAIVPIEPAIIIIYNLYRLVKVLCSGELRVKLKQTLHIRLVFKILYVALPVFIGLVYSVLVIIWVAFYLKGYSEMDFILSVTLCIGWLYTISFTRGFRLIHYFWRMIQNMIVKDILKFLFIYLFVLLAFSFAFHSVFQISQAVADTYPSPFDTAFLVFNLMIGMGELFTDDFQSGMDAVGRDTVYVKVLYLFYMVLGTILLLNLLIAMMNDSYSAILHQHAVSWRVEAVQLGVDIERTFPLSTRIFSSIKFRKGLPKDLVFRAKRASIVPGAEGSPDSRVMWYISVPERHARFESLADDVTEREVMRDVKMKMTSLEQRVTSDLQQMKHDLEDIRVLLKDLHHRGQN